MGLLRNAAPLLAAVALVSAQEAKPRVIGKQNAKVIGREQIHALHRMMDRDGSSRVTLEEMLMFHVNTKESSDHLEAQVLFEEIDKDGNQRVPLEELEDWLDESNPNRARWSVDEKAAWQKSRELDKMKFDLADKNKDGSLNSMEIVGFLFPESDLEIYKFGAWQTFDTYDRDGDGFLSFEEFLAGDKHDPEDIEITHIEEKEFEILDFDKDGQLDLKEFVVVNSGFFQAEHNMKLIMSHADRDGDGVSVMELDEAYEKIKDSTAAHDLLKDAVEHHEL